MEVFYKSCDAIRIHIRKFFEDDIETWMNLSKMTNKYSTLQPNSEWNQNI